MNVRSRFLAGVATSLFACSGGVGGNSNATPGADGSAPDVAIADSGGESAVLDSPGCSTSASASYASNEKLIVIPTRSGVSLPFDLVKPLSSAMPIGVVILLSGSDGKLALTDQGMSEGASQNFVVRTRQDYTCAGFGAAIPDVPSDQPNGLEGMFRSSEAHAQDMQALVAWLKSKWNVPVWMVSTSRGTISAANAASRSTQNGPDGIVLTSCVTVDPGDAGQDSLTNVDLASIRVPVRVLDNTEDGCPASPFSAAEAMAAARSWPFVSVTGGMQPTGGDPCGPLSYHGFYGLDAQVVAEILKFLNP
jgi:hypothetical protein